MTTSSSDREADQGSRSTDPAAVGRIAGEADIDQSLRAPGANQQVVSEFRAAGGRIGGRFETVPLLLLTTEGAKSGQAHTVPVRWYYAGDQLFIVAAGGTSRRLPDWYYNLLAHPMVRVETGAETYGALALPAEGMEHEQLLAHVVREAPGYHGQPGDGSQSPPVVVLERSYSTTGMATAVTLADGLVAIHDWLRGLLAEVRAEADAQLAAGGGHEGAGGGIGPGLTLQIRQRCLAFCGGLHRHHTDEDARILPDLERRRPSLRHVLARLRHEHRAVEQLRAQLAGLLSDIGTGDPGQFRAELDRMSSDLEAHLAYEEEWLLPALANIPLAAARGADDSPGARG